MATAPERVPLFGSGTPLPTLYDFSAGRYRITSDKRAQFRLSRMAATPTLQFHEKFIERRRDMLRMASLSTESHNRSAEILTRALNSTQPPVPGGVGYGVFYTPEFHHAFQTGTVLAFDIVARRSLSGNVSDWLYLTAMNRAALGVEAFLSYFADQSCHFKVFDWSRDDHWQVDKTLDDMSEYIGTRVVQGVEYPIVSLQNQTIRIAPDQWQNNAWLVNQVSGDYDLVYSNTYAALDAKQKDAFMGSWGPIVETFQDHYTGTEHLGFIGAYLQARDEAMNWGQWALLDDSQSFIRDDGKGFSLLHLEPNHTFIVSS